MTGGRCYRRKMLGRGAEAEEKPCPASRASSNAAASTATRVEGVDIFAQARKALSEHSPFGEPEELARVSTLPVGLATSLLKSSESRRKHKKSEDSVKKVPSVPQPSKVWSLWTETEEYFRPITVPDIDILASRCQIAGSLSDSCFTIPVVDSIEKQKLPTKELDASPLEEHENVDVVAFKDDDSRQNEGFENGTSINWILCSKQRRHMISERPSKKRKLVNLNDGLRNWMLLPNPLPDGSRICDCCCSGDDNDAENRLMCCNSCKVSVHMKCYGIQKFPKDSWLCSWCRLMESTSGSEKACVLCPKKEGALKIVGTPINQSGHASKFAHLFCCLWIPEVFVENIEMMEPIMNAEGFLETRKRPVCSICKMKEGACIRCSHGRPLYAYIYLCFRGTNCFQKILQEHAMHHSMQPVPGIQNYGWKFGGRENLTM